MAKCIIKSFAFWLGLSFQNIRKKSLYEAVEIIVSKFLYPTKSNAYVQYFMDIVLERDIRNQAGISDFLNFWEKNSEKFSIPSPEGNNAVRFIIYLLKYLKNNSDKEKH